MVRNIVLVKSDIVLVKSVLLICLTASLFVSACGDQTNAGVDSTVGDSSVADIRVDVRIDATADVAANDQGSVDQGSVDLGVIADAAIDAPDATDARGCSIPTSDAAVVDSATTSDGGCACTTGQSCLRGVCVATCGGTTAALDTALAAGMVPVANVCFAAGFNQIPFEVRGDVLWYVNSTSDAAGTRFTVYRRALSGVGEPVAVATAMHAEAVVDGGMVGTYTGGYFAMNPCGTRGLFGYTVGRTENAEYVGGMFNVDTGAMTIAETSANGNYGAVFVSDTDYLVSAQSFRTLHEGVGIYMPEGNSGARRVFGNIGAANGAITTLMLGTTAYLVFGGSTYPDDTVFVHSLANVFAAATVNATTEPTIVRTAMASDFRRVGPAAIALLAYQTDITMRTLSNSVAAPTWSAPVRLGTSAFRNVGAATPGTIVLQHANGFLHVRLPS